MSSLPPSIEAIMKDWLWREPEASWRVEYTQRIAAEACRLQREADLGWSPAFKSGNTADWPLVVRPPKDTGNAG